MSKSPCLLSCRMVLKRNHLVFIVYLQFVATRAVTQKSWCKNRFLQSNGKVDHVAGLCNDSLDVTLKQLGEKPADPVLSGAVYSKEKVTTKYRQNLLNFDDVLSEAVLLKMMNSFERYTRCLTKTNITECSTPRNSCTVGGRPTENSLTILFEETNQLQYNLQCFEMPRPQRRKRSSKKKGGVFYCCGKPVETDLICYGCLQIVTNGTQVNVGISKQSVKQSCHAGFICIGSQVILPSIGGRVKPKVQISHLGSALLLRTKKSFEKYSNEDTERIVHSKIIYKALATVLKNISKIKKSFRKRI